MRIDIQKNDEGAILCFINETEIRNAFHVSSEDLIQDEELVENFVEDTMEYVMSKDYFDMSEESTINSSLYLHPQGIVIAFKQIFLKDMKKNVIMDMVDSILEHILENEEYDDEPIIYDDDHVLCFKNMDDVMRIIPFIKDKKASLYRYQSNLYLITNDDNVDFRVHEFTKPCQYPKEYIQEHGNVIIEKHAVQTLKTL